MCLIVFANLLLPSPVAAAGAATICVAVCLSTAAVILVDGVLALLIRHLPGRWFAHGIPVSRRECRLYVLLGVRRWKDKIPELGVFTGFHKNKVYRPKDNAYIARFILECRYGVAIHLAGALLGFLIVFLYPFSYAPWIGVPVGVVNAVLNVLPVMALRYNLPKLEALYTLNGRRDAAAAVQGLS